MNVECQRSERMTNGEKVMPGRIRHAGFVIDSSFVIRHPSFSPRSAFTLIELIVVTAVIIILTGLVLSTVGYVQKKGARARAETEIAAISAACESYKADNGTYPRDPTANTATDSLDARTMGDPVTTNTTLYKAASLVLYRALSGDRDLNRIVDAADESR